MSNTLLQKSLRALTCRQQGHQNEPLSCVCISSQCKHTLVICYLCSLEQHEEHQKIPLKLFFKQLFSIQSKSQKVIPLCAQIDQIFRIIRNKLLACKQSFSNPQIVIKTFEQFKDKNITQTLSFSSLIQKVADLFLEGQEQNVLEKLNKFIKNQYFKYFAGIVEEEWKNFDLGENLLNKNIEKLNSILGTIQKLKSTHKISDTQVLNLFPLAQQSFKKVKIFFSEDLKPACMKIISPTQAKMDGSGSERLIALQPCLSKTMSVKKWGVRIIKLASWIGVGVCHLSEIQKAKYMFNYTNTGHGNYLISSNGYAWSSYKKQFNSKFQPFGYTTDDVIHIEYDPKLRMVRFKKESDPNQPTYQLQIQDNGDPIHPQINMTGANDQVQIINF